MATSIERARREVQSAWEQARAIAEEDGQLHDVEARLWTALLAVGRSLVSLFLVRTAARARATRYRQDGSAYALDGTTRTSKLGTRFGNVTFTRPVGHAVGARKAADLLVDRALGLCSGFSLNVVTGLVRLCTLMAFATARATFAEFHGWAPSQRATLRMVDALGGQVEGFIEDAPAPENDGEILVAQVDGRGAPMITSTEYDRRRKPKRRKGRKGGTARLRRRQRRREYPKPRRKKGDKSKNAKVAFVAVVYTLRVTPDGVEGPINKRTIATFESHEALFKMLQREAIKRGYGTKRTIFLADGSDHIWRNQKKYLPDAEICVDWYHVMEKLWEAGTCLFREGSAELAAWVAEQTARLRRGQIRALYGVLLGGLDSLPKTGPGNKGRRKRLSGILDHLIKQEDRLNYRNLRRDDLDIGTGAAEGAVRNVVGIRLDGPGMRWGRERAEALLRLRCVFVNGQWDDFSAYVSSRGLRLAPKPVPARAHDAESQEPDDLDEAA